MIRLLLYDTVLLYTSREVRCKNVAVRGTLIRLSYRIEILLVEAAEVRSIDSASLLVFTNDWF